MDYSKEFLEQIGLTNEEFLERHLKNLHGWQRMPIIVRTKQVSFYTQDLVPA